MADPIHILVVDDHAVVREGLRTFLALQEGFEIVGEAADGEEALEQAARLDPDVILDFVHGSHTGFRGDLPAAWQQLPELKVVRQRCVYPVNEDYVPHASQRMVQTAALFSRMIHQAPKRQPTGDSHEYCH